MARLERDEDWASRWGATRQDIQNARRIIGEGKGWVDRLEAALKNGAILPAVGAAVLGTVQQGEPQQGLVQQPLPDESGRL